MELGRGDVVIPRGEHSGLPARVVDIYWSFGARPEVNYRNRMLHGNRR